MTRCVICRRSCIPMADYDIPVCPYCDAGNAAPRTGKTLPEWAARLPLSYAAGPGDPTAIAELMAAFRYDPKHRTASM